MSVKRIVQFTCDPCGKVKDVDIGGLPPLGWTGWTIEPETEYVRCPDCEASYEKWLQSRKAVANG